MNYIARPKQNETNVRKLATTTGVLIRKVGVNDILEGDDLVKDGLGRDWLFVLLINGVQTGTPHYVATWVCNIETPPPPMEYPDFVYDASTTSDQPITVYFNDVLVREFPAGTIRVVSKNPILKLT